MPARLVLMAVGPAVVLTGCGGGASTGPDRSPLANANAGGTYRGCLPGTDIVALGGIIPDFGADGGPVVVERIDVLTDPGSVAAADGVPLLDVHGLETAFASPIDAAYRAAPEFGLGQVTARPDGRLGEPNRLGWHSLVVPVHPQVDQLIVYDLALRYRLDGSESMDSTIGVQWSLSIGDECAPYGTGLLESDDAQWVTVFEAHDGEPWEVNGRVED